MGATAERGREVMFVIKHGITKAKQQLNAFPLITNGCYIKQRECQEACQS